MIATYLLEWGADEKVREIASNSSQTPGIFQ